MNIKRQTLVEDPPRDSGTRVKTMPSLSERLELSDFDDDTSPGDPNVVLFKHFLKALDDLSPHDRQRLLIIAEAFVEMHPDNRTVLTNAAERMAGLVDINTR